MAGESNEPEQQQPEAAISDINPAASVVRPDQIPVAAPLAEVLPRADAGAPPLVDIESHVSEFLSDVAGPLSPFGDEVEFPLPVSRLSYRHPGPANRPALAGD
jgi:hypothetical protein